MTTLAPVKAEAGQRVEYFTPVVNLHQDADGFTLEVEMPGVGKQGVEVTVEDGKLILGGHRTAASNDFGRARLSRAKNGRVPACF